MNHDSIVRIEWEENEEKNPIARTRHGLFFDWDKLCIKCRGYMTSHQPKYRDFGWTSYFYFPRKTDAKTFVHKMCYIRTRGFLKCDIYLNGILVNTKGWTQRKGEVKLWQLALCS